MFSLAKKLSLTVRGVMASAIDNLFTALKGRATYSENIADSKQVVKDIDNYELLDKASILLTPTAYSNALVHSVKTNVSGEFVTDNNFPNFDNWTEGTGWTTSNGKAVHTQSVGGGDVYQVLNLQVGRKYLFKAKIDATSDIVLSNTAMQIRDNNNTFSVADLLSGASEILPKVVNDLELVFTATQVDNLVRFYSADEISIYDVSITDVSSDFDFDRASSATRINSDGLVQDMQSITDPELVLNGDFEELGDNVVTNGTFDTDSDWTIQNNTGTDTEITSGNLIIETDGAYTQVSQSSILVGGNQYKLIYTILSSDNGDLGLVTEGNLTVSIPSSVGTHTYYFTAHSTSFILKRRGGALNVTIDNVSVQQVDPNDRWTLGTSWSIEDGVASYEGGSNSAIIQNISLTSGNVYNIKFTVSNASGNASIFIGNGSGNVNYFGASYADYANGDYDLHFTMPSTQSTLAFYGESTGSNFSIDNISVKDITFSEDVDLARINYDSNGENGHWLLEPTSTNLVPYSEDFTTWTIQSGTTVTSNTTETLSPSGEYNSSKIVGNGTSGILKASVSSAGGSNTKSIYIKGTQNGQVVYLKDPNQTVNNKALTLTTEWARYSLTETQTSNYGIWIANIPSEGIYMYGGQVEALSYATSYIPSLTGSTVTRATETLTGSGNSTLINSTEGVLYAEIAALVDDNSAREITLSDGTADNRIELRYGAASNRIQLVARSGGVVQASLTNSTNNILNFNKVAVKWKANDFALWINGIEQGADTSGSTPIGLNELQFNEGDGAGGEFLGKVKALAVFDEALTDDELELLTGITNYGSFNELAQANGYTII